MSSPLYTPVEDAWREIMASATIGTERAPRSLDVGELFGGLLSSLKEREPEHALLGAAAAIFLYRQAGRLPELHPKSSSLTPCEAEVLPRCSPAASRHLQMMLQGQHRDVLPEWLAALKRKGGRVPEEFLPALLDLGKKEKSLRPLLMPVLGKRGEWLAAQNSDWSYLVGEELDESHWETGSGDERLALLRLLREREPDRARELVASTWESEKPESRAAFLGAFEVGLSMADEPFLETALDDRRKEVRKTAAGLLFLLPDSRLVQRMTARLRPLLNWKVEKGGLLGMGREQTQLDVTLPTECDKGMVRDGVERKPEWGYDAGERQWWLQQMLGVVPPDHWTRTWDARPEDILRAASHSEFKPILTRGWSVAAARCELANWMVALLESWRKGEALIESPQELIYSLPLTQREAFLIRHLREMKGYLSQESMELTLLQEYRHPWSEELAREVLRAIHKSIYKLNWMLESSLEQFALYIPPHLITEIEKETPEEVRQLDNWSHRWHQFLSLLQFRSDMLKELAP